MFCLSLQQSASTTPPQGTLWSIPVDMMNYDLRIFTFEISRHSDFELHNSF